MIWEIIMIIVGIGLVVAGYVIPDKKDKENADLEEYSREQVQAIVDEEMEAAKGQISDIVDETITYAMEKTERSMDRISNEKMMAVSEYSDTVLEQIGKSHEEVVFLYDMLNDKHENLMETVAQASKTADEVKEKLKEAEDLTPIVVNRIQENAVAKVVAEPAIEEEAPKEKAPSKKRNKPVPIIKSEPVIASPESAYDVDEEDSFEDEWNDFDDDDDFDPSEEDGPEISFNARTPGNRNSNDRILELHKAGKSNMAIAKELGLGVGEVKLVIDLFKGM